MDRDIIKNLDIDYDEDVLDVMIGKPYPTENYELDLHITLRFDPKSKELVGMTIVNYSHVFPGSQTPEQRKFLSGALLNLFKRFYNENIFKIPHPKRAA